MKEPACKLQIHTSRILRKQIDLDKVNMAVGVNDITVRSIVYKMSCNLQTVTPFPKPSDTSCYRFAQAGRPEIVIKNLSTTPDL